MTHPEDKFFIPFAAERILPSLPDQFSLMADKPHPLCVKAVAELQYYLQHQRDWDHNFGLSGNGNGLVTGKMFGVLVAQNVAGKIGYIAAFSGKLAGTNQHGRFVPAVFDALTEGSFLNEGMPLLTELSLKIKELQSSKPKDADERIAALKATRKSHSLQLQQQLFDNYYFRNKAGVEKSVAELFRAAGYKNPPSGAGECAGPKLLQYAFRQRMKPLAMAEFWWGQSPKSAQWQHGHFYACCDEKCAPVLAHMLTSQDSFPSDH